MTNHPQPENWRTRPVLVAFGALIFIAGTVYLSAQTATAIHAGRYLVATILGSLGVFFLCILLAGAIGKLRSNTLRAVWDSRGTTFRSDPVVRYVMVVCLAAGALGSSLYVICNVFGCVEFPFPTPGRGIVTQFYMTCLSIGTIIGLVAVIRRGRSAHLRLTAHGIENADLSRNRKVSWDHITDITDVPAVKFAYRPPKPISFDVKDDDPMVLRNGGGYTPNGAALYWMIRHYWLHPENRGELADGRALERLRSEQFEPE